MYFPITKFENSTLPFLVEVMVIFQFLANDGIHSCANVRGRNTGERTH